MSQGADPNSNPGPRPGAGVSQDELMAWIEGELRDPAAGDVERRLSADPELAVWARSARADRLALGALARADRAQAPRGLWREALDEAERRALLLDEAVGAEGARRGPVVFKLTPPRLVAAAAILIVASLGAIAPFLTGGSGPGAPNVAQGPVDAGERASGIEGGAFVRGDEVRPGLSMEQAIAQESRAASEMAKDAAEPSPRALDALASGAVEPESTNAPTRPSDPSDLVAGPPEAPAVRTLLASHYAADPNGIVAGRAAAGPLLSGYRNLSTMEPRRRPMPGAFPDSWGLSVAQAQSLAAEQRLAAIVRTDDLGSYLHDLLGAMGRRAVVVSPGTRNDRNGLSAPVEVLVSAPVSKTERALRLCAIGARDVRLAPLPARGRPGEWASEALWWSATDRDEGLIRVYVVER